MLTSNSGVDRTVSVIEKVGIYFFRFAVHWAAMTTPSKQIQIQHFFSDSKILLSKSTREV